MRSNSLINLNPLCAQPLESAIELNIVRWRRSTIMDSATTIQIIITGSASCRKRSSSMSVGFAPFFTSSYLAGGTALNTRYMYKTNRTSWKRARQANLTATTNMHVGFSVHGGVSSKVDEQSLDLRE